MIRQERARARIAVSRKILHRTADAGARILPLALAVFGWKVARQEVGNMRTSIITLSIAALLALGAPALAKQKQARAQLSYEDAWALCKKFVDQGVLSWDQTQQRYSRGAACMKKYGHRI
jgi:hypothetical protein